MWIDGERVNITHHYFWNNDFYFRRSILDGTTQVWTGHAWETNLGQLAA